MFPKYARIRLKWRAFRLYCRLRKRMGSPDFKNDSAVAEFLGYSRGLLSQILSAARSPEKYPEFRLSSEFIATILTKFSAHFEELFEIVDDPGYDPNNKYTKFFKNG